MHHSLLVCCTLSVLLTVTECMYVCLFRAFSLLFWNGVRIGSGAWAQGNVGDVLVVCGYGGYSKAGQRERNAVQLHATHSTAQHGTAQTRGDSRRSGEDRLQGHSDIAAGSMLHRTALHMRNINLRESGARGWGQASGPRATLLLPLIVLLHLECYAPGTAPLIQSSAYIAQPQFLLMAPSPSPTHQALQAW